VTDKPFNFFTRLLNSSSFTIVWALADFLFFNLFYYDVMTDESGARHWVERLISPNRGEIEYFAATVERHCQLIIQGANFIQQDVLANASVETIALFKELDPFIFMFILVKAVYIYTAGAKKNDEIPKFFKSITKDLILILRQEMGNEETVQELQRLISDPTQFETEPRSESAKSAFLELKKIASGELRKSIFITDCFQKTIEQLPPTENEEAQNFVPQEGSL